MAEAAACRSGRGEPPPFRRVRPAVAYEILRDSPEALVLDLRAPEEFIAPEGHVKGAINIPAERLLWRLAEISGYRDQTFLVYCRDAGCGDAEMRVLISGGYLDAILIDGGFAAWVTDGFDTVLAVMPKEGQAASSEVPLAPAPAEPDQEPPR